MWQNELQSAIKQAVQTMSSALTVFWPSAGKNDMGEANLSMHFGAALQGQQFHIFSEVWLEQLRRAKDEPDDARSRIDLLAVRDGWFIGSEAKRLYQDPSKALQIVADWERMKTHRPTTAFGNPTPKRWTRVLLATTWQDDIAETWTTRNSAKGGGWGVLAGALQEAELVGQEILQEDRHWGKQRLLWAFA